MKKAIAYCRFSSSHQREESIDAQKRAINEYCRRNSIALGDVYVDEAQSATTDNRPAFLQLFKDIKDKDYDMLIVHKLDRFARDRFDSAFYKRKLKESGMRLISVLENLDGSPESIILESVLDGMSEYYSRNLAREVMKGLSETAYQCKHTGGKPPLGYKVNADGTYAIDPVDSVIVKRIFDMYNKGYSYRDIADALNEDGIRTRTGKKFTKNSFHDLLINEKYKGVYVFNRSSSAFLGKRNNHSSKDDESIIRIDGGMPAIVDKELWEKVNNKMHGNKRSGEKKAKRVYLLSGMIFCGECGSPMSGNTRTAGRLKQKYSTYECNRRRREKTCDLKAINKEFIETAVLDYLVNDFFTDENIEKMADQLLTFRDDNLSSYDSELPELRKKLSEHKKQLQNVIRNIEEGYGSDWLIQQGDYHDDQVKYFSGRIQHIENQRSSSTLTKQQIIDYISKDRDLKNKKPEDLKLVIQAYIEKVVVFNDTIDIHSIVDMNGGDGESRTRVQNQFHAAFSERILCKEFSPIGLSKGRISDRLSRCSLMLPGFHIRFPAFVRSDPVPAGELRLTFAQNYAANAKLLFVFLAFIFNVPFLTQTEQTAARLLRFSDPVETFTSPKLYL